jgi:lipopolysaccharide transport system ATP-binding protein
MSEVVIRVENLSKQYRLGQVGTGSLKDDFKRWRYKMLGKEDPFLTVGEENDRAVKSNADYVWALQNISFEIKQGELIGIIGKNGAGKSTLLKILSRTTGPTTGSLKMKGRVASLLEVGTGFHGELSGRENIFLNGAIMGMRKSEIKNKLDEIIDFAGVERYIDTPVKRYSSGMYVRLAFGVAAHLEPDILIVDEVLAVGDAEFQKKAIGKMQDVSKGGGRTVIFVSHNMTAVKNLCKRGILLANGKIETIGNIGSVVDKYLSSSNTDTKKAWALDNAPGTDKARLVEVEIKSPEETLYIDRPIDLYFKVYLAPSINMNREINFSLVLNNREQIPVFNVVSEPKFVSDDVIEATCHIPAHLLNDEYYSIRILIVENKSTALFDIEDILSFKMEERNRDGTWHGKWVGLVRPQQFISWTY